MTSESKADEARKLVAEFRYKGATYAVTSFDLLESLAAELDALRAELASKDARIRELEGALEPFADAFERHKYGNGVSARDWKRAYDTALSARETEGK